MGERSPDEERLALARDREVVDRLDEDELVREAGLAELERERLLEVLLERELRGAKEAQVGVVDEPAEPRLLVVPAVEVGEPGFEVPDRRLRRYRGGKLPRGRRVLLALAPPGVSPGVAVVVREEARDLRALPPGHVQGAGPGLDDAVLRVERQLRVEVGLVVHEPELVVLGAPRGLECELERHVLARGYLELPGELGVGGEHGSGDEDGSEERAAHEGRLHAPGRVNEVGGVISP